MKTPEMESANGTLLHILMLEDNPVDAELVTYALRKGGLSFESKRVETEEDFVKELTDFQPDVILLDYELPTFNGSSALIIAKSTTPDTPAIFVTGVMGEESAIDMLHRGATDYVLKDNLSRLVPAVSRALSEVEELSKRRAAEEALRKSEEALRRTQFTVDHSADSVFWLTPEAKIIYANEEACRRRGYTREEMLLLTIFDISIDFAGDQGVFDTVRGRLRESGRFTDESRHCTKDGEVFPVEAVLNLLEFEGNEILVANFRDITERKKAEKALRESEESIRRKLDAILEPEGDIGELELCDIIDSEAIQSLMEDFYRLTNIGVAVSDRSATILVATGWQDICTQFHRVHPETKKHCIESDIELSKGVEFGTFKLYRCKNNMWDLSTPIVVTGNHVGNLYLGQFFFEDETPDYELFRRQARLYGFDEREYIEALDRVPRWSRETVDTVMTLYTKFTGLVSSLGHSKIALARALSEKDKILARLGESQDLPNSQGKANNR